jgi:peptidoglycan/xylan/chitin deacetylase (PgdA/CDA1 family)
MYNGSPVVGAGFGHLFLKSPLLFGCIGVASALGYGVLGEDYDKIVSFTFDDGRVSVFEHVYPEFASRDIVGTLQLNSDTLDTYDIMTTAQVSLMERTGWYVGNHTMSHLDLTDISLDAVDVEIGGNLERMSDLFTKDITVFASPFGSYDDDVLEIASEYHDYHLRSNGGMNHIGSINPMEINRFQLDYEEPRTMEAICQEVVGSVNTWTVFNAHDIVADRDQVGDYHVHIDDLMALVDCLRDNGIPIMPVEEAVGIVF